HDADEDRDFVALGPAEALSYTVNPSDLINRYRLSQRADHLGQEKPSQQAHRCTDCALKQKTPVLSRARGFVEGSLALTYFRAVYLALSSALPRFTVLFGMGRRGSRALWAPDIACRFVDSGNEANSKEAGWDCQA